MKLIRFFAAVVLVLVATLLAGTMINLAYAQAVVAPSTEVVIPWGDWFVAASSNINTILVALVMWALRKLPENILAIILTMRLDQILLKAIDAAINKTVGASKGQVLKVDVANEVLATAVSYAIKHGPKWMVDWAGGELAIREKIIARLDVEAAAALK